MSRIRLVVFDLDGTLVDASADITTGLNLALARLAPGTAPLPEADVRRMIGDGARVLVTRAVARAGLPLSPEDVLPVFLECYGAHLLDETRLYPDVAETLHALHGRTLAVLTNKPGDMSRAILAGLGVANAFHRVIGGGDVPAKKPDPGGLRELMDAASASPAETAMVGDSAIDVRTGRALGVLTIGVTYGLSPESLAQDPPDHLVSRFAAVPALLG